MMRAITCCLVMTSGWSIGCEERRLEESPDIADKTPVWQRDTNGRWVIPLGDKRSNPELLAAITDGRGRAEQTRDAVRVEWNTLLPVEQQQWSILWAAPTDAADGVESELLWVIPLSWTEHRVEATLASTPGHRTDLALGDLVGFPIEELADWADHSTTPPRGNEVLKAVELVIGPAPRKGS